MRRVIIKHPKMTLLDVIVDGFGNIYEHKCINGIYKAILEEVIEGKYELEFEDGIFKIDEGSVFKNLEKLKEHPLFKDRIIVEKVDC